MNQYLFLRRMRGPIILLTFGITAILDEYAGIGYSRSWPLYLIVWGLLKLAENAILAQHPPVMPGQYAGAPGYPAPGATTAAPGDMTPPGTSIVPLDATSHEDEERR
ncbi:MAG TPA: hypothetical protein VHX13_00405 [Acidobacteriaceae bacterium]|jgi:hypothetical protein|nr:hypothetical protein [Acidobacteriaceae bacterium]